MKTTLFSIAFAAGICVSVYGQEIVTGHVFDSETKEPLIGASVIVRSNHQGMVTDFNGGFSVAIQTESDTLEVSYIGYDKTLIAKPASEINVPLSAAAGNLEQIVVTANREAALRTESPIAINKISATTISDTKPILIAELINKVPGALMLNYNNEQHGMSIRQPMGTSAYFLYLEDGIPLRPMGIFNHNALIEMNVFGISNIEVVKGPASSLYGPEAVGGAINFITHRPTAMPTAKLGIEADQWGYKRIQYAAGGTVAKKLGIYVSGFQGEQRNSWQASSDYNKSSLNVRMDYSPGKRTKVTAAFSGNEYYSDMPGSVDSLSFYNRDYSTSTDFTYRKVHSQRTRLTLSHEWNDDNETVVTLAYRDNYIEQKPNYAIRWNSGSNTASGERNRNSFYSRVLLLQHTARFNFLDASLLGGGSIDFSPTDYWAYQIDLAAQLRPDGKSIEKFSILREKPDDFISDYRADLKNYALYSQLQINPVQRLKVTFGLRYDRMMFDYENALDASSGNKSFEQITPKLGATFDLLHDKGLYVNYSEGFSPPGLTSIFRKRPDTAGSEFYYDLEPARFSNVEVGGWGAFLENKIYVDAALYQMTGHNELLNIRQPDNSTDYQSAGKTLHRGIEYGITFQPSSEWQFRLGGTNAIHRFQEFEVSTRATDEIRNVDGNDMPQSPRWIANSEVTFKPRRIDGLRLALEWQRIGTWYEDYANNVRYDDRGFPGLKGVSYLNLRVGYEVRGFEMFANVMNLTDELYANSATHGNTQVDRTAYTPAAPRTFVFGVQYAFTGKIHGSSQH